MNPVAGTCDATEVERALRDECERSEWHLTVRTTPGPVDIAAWTRAIVEPGFDRVVVAGGDGTVAAVASGAGEGPSLAVIPVGTANVLARELGLPLEVEPACRLAVRGRPRAVDGMGVGGRLYFSHVSMGRYSEIAQESSSGAKRRWKRLAYVVKGISKFLGRRSWRFRIQADDEVCWVRASSVLVANAGSVGAASFRWGPGIALDDGVLDVCVLQAHSLPDHLAIGWRIVTGRHRASPDLRYLRARRFVRIEPDRSRHVPVRGDLGTFRCAETESRSVAAPWRSRWCPAHGAWWFRRTAIHREAATVVPTHAASRDLGTPLASSRRPWQPRNHFIVAGACAGCSFRAC